ncbi:Protein of unknown function [Pyronema omphalodes CBS 100304]|uniref:Uncharacterized protein n=1 Tax=Pyronema omphalodes (strain CBS 100304) TaxID=1076935 RepID=U4KW03_PYROM|nr:Protein of unknown function [Pyronema omphalodes CBS 100304]
MQLCMEGRRRALVRVLWFSESPFSFRQRTAPATPSPVESRSGVRSRKPFRQSTVEAKSEDSSDAKTREPISSLLSAPFLKCVMIPLHRHNHWQFHQQALIFLWKAWEVQQSH